ncbi:site-specific integrase [Companilactobacillus mishanensis]|uniref:Site-specific integrase n=1 Tax=Companilactobacillus mishanensis TaxID=2486008 RepID=A0A5P0ZGF0_9LACO|nr:site-specific integrase [Companilactobacillus mishanensis]MQS52133.1 site-specific integrase [Companilactobacillus mishanensis]
MTEIKKYEKKDGSTAYKFKVYLGVNPFTGKESRANRTGFKTKKEAKLALNKVQLDFQNKGLNQLTKQPFKTIYEKWFKQYKTTVKESTFSKTEEHFTLHILPLLGRIPIVQMKTIQIQHAVNVWFKKGLSRYKRFYNYVYRIFEWAIKMQIVDDNPAVRVMLPVDKKQHKTMKNNYYNLEEFQHFFICLQDLDNPQALMFFRTLAYTGMRKGECLALTWNDINFETKQISITKTQSQGEHGRLLVNTPKTDASVRTVDLDDDTIDMLKNWRKLQLKNLTQLGFNSLQKDQLVFSNRKNKMLVPVKPRTWLQLTINRYDLKNVTVHSFRRTYATLAVESGSTLKEVQEQLGHSDYRTTANIYTEVTSNQKKETSQRFANYVNK